jgi:hypothetical protein
MGTSLLSSRQKSMLALCLLISLLAAPAFSAPDFDGNGQIGLSDFFLFADHFGSADAVFDLDANGEVGLSDFFLFASAFGRSAVGVPSPDQGSNGTLFQRRWSYVSETSAVVYWQLGDIGEEGLSYVEYGRTRDLGRRTESTESHPHPRRAHLHRLRDLKSGFVYYYRMVVFDPSSGREAKSEILTFTTHSREGVIRVPDDLSGPPFILDRAGATYLLTRDVSAPGTAFEITASDVTLDLDGHTVLFGDDTDQQVRGVWVRNEGAAVVCNGHIVQGRRSGDYSSAVASRWRPQPTEIFGISTDVHLKCAYPVKMFGATAHLRLHHNHLYSRVTEIESRHYPGNDLLRLDIDGGDIHIHDNLLTEGCHVGIRLIGKGANVEVDHNDIRHHQQYVNGYALSVSCAGSDVHHNRITSCGRGVHLTGDGIHLHDNYLDIYGHQQLSDLPQGSRPFKHQKVELHGIKLEGRGVKNCLIYGNSVRIVQKLPRASGGIGSPDDKISSGVYLHSLSSSLTADRLTDVTRSWEADRWKGYFVRYAPDLPPVRILGNDATSLLASFAYGTPSAYTIYMQWEYVPATPLNIASYDPNAMNEIRDNTFVALSEYPVERIGTYGDSGEWASTLHLVGMDKGEAQPGNYSAYIHDNRFTSNHLFVSADRTVDMTVRVEENIFTLSSELPPLEGHRPFRNIDRPFAETIAAGANAFVGMTPER